MVHVLRAPHAPRRPPPPTPFLPSFLSISRAGLLIQAMYSAAPALDRIRQEQEEALVAAYTAKEAETVVDVGSGGGEEEDGGKGLSD